MSFFYTTGQHRSEIERRLDLVSERLHRFTDLDKQWSAPPALEFGAAIEQISRIQERYHEPFRLAVVGEFNVGKSTLINGLLGLPGTLPEGIVPTTGAVTELWHGNGTGTVVSSEGKTLFEGSLEDAREYCDQRTEQGHQVNGLGTRVILRADSSLLENLVIIDTPGLGANVLDDQVTFDALRIADAALLVLSGLQPGGEDSLLLSERLRAANRKLITVVTRIDQVADELDTVYASVTKEFGAVSTGDPIGVYSPGICRAFTDLKQAEELGDDDLAQQARQQLTDFGYTRLREVLTDTFMLGDAGTRRALTALTDLRTIVLGLQDDTEAEAREARKQAAQLTQDISELDAHLHNVLTNKEIFLRAKVAEVVDEHVGDLMNRLSEASDAFIMSLAEGRFTLGLQALVGKMSQRQRERVERRLADDFEDIFPRSNYDMTVRTIAVRLRPLMELEWREAITLFQIKAPDMVNIEKLTRKLAESTGSMVLSGTSQLAAAVALLFVPGAQLIDAAILVGASGVRTVQGQKLPKKIAAIQQQTRIRLQSERAKLWIELTETFQAANAEVAETIKAPVVARRTARQQQAAEGVELADRWAQVADDLGKLAREEQT
ncbi:hypothetical protein JOF56_005179 [Kibdelosporangium banguiense]|uniref:Dynamin N-terminal domain-containing protein n=1 Tax=Kibdelosporangium banguiense TaxID=1365924 RepID=A0ABS4TKD9_9PSEU|nr:dynamin family protein [Kibdelosporangium banguiense]MBP2324794.1 hypothetical protein [Kibdelosporangium banguiense]